MKRTPIICAVVFAFSTTTLTQCIEPQQSMYLNQKPPGLEAQVFAPGTISVKDQYEYGSFFSGDGKEFYYAVIVNKKPQIRLAMYRNNKWAEPTVLLASDQYEYNDPFLSPGQKRLFFISDRAIDGKGDKNGFRHLVH